MQRALWLFPLILAAPVREDRRPANPSMGASIAALPSVLSALPAPPRAAISEPEATGAYVPGQVMVRPPPGSSLSDLAARAGARIVSEVGASGFGVLEVADDALPRLHGAALARVGRTRGALSGARPAAPNEHVSTALRVDLPPSWHLELANVPPLSSAPGIVVAVLDTGVAYEDTGAHVAAAGLEGVTFVAPADFVELDGHPNDDHQHGTHIASLIASEGAWPGVVPGASIMPVKVLDASNAGTEWALVEGLHHAIDHGADVINLSLSFPLGYVPSRPLLEALARAWDEGVVVVAAAGNDGAPEITWPAASRTVIAVGASSSSPLTMWDQATYSNVSPRLDLLAPGGSIALDADVDGWPDGLLAETIGLGDPTRLGMWFYEGTSQATAVVSGAVAHLLAAGVAPADVAATLQQGRGGYDLLDAMMAGSGADSLDLRGALAAPTLGRDTHVGLLPYLVTDRRLGAVPHARVTALDAAGEPLEDVDVVATVASVEGISWTSCTTGADGRCDLVGETSGTTDAWAFRVEALVEGPVAHRPASALFTSEALEATVAALDLAGLEDALLAVRWPAGFDEELDAELAEAWAVVDSGPSSLSSPLGVVFAPSHLAPLATESEVPLDLDGAEATFSVLTIDGTGLLSSPLGTFSSLRLVGLSGSGLLSSPLGFHSTQLLLRGSSVDEAHLELGGIEPGAWLVATGAVEVGLARADAPGRPGVEPRRCVEWVAPR